LRRVGLGGQGGTAVTGVSPLTVAGDRRDGPGPVDPADPLVPAIGDEKVALAIEGQVRGAGQPGRGGGSAVTREGPDTGAGDGRDEAGLGVDPADPVVDGVGHEKVAGGVDRQPSGVELGRRGRTAVTRGTDGPVAGDDVLLAGD